VRSPAPRVRYDRSLPADFPFPFRRFDRYRPDSIFMETADFDYFLPPDRIAQHPTPVRDQSRLLVCHRETRSRQHRRFDDLLNLLRPSDLLVFNDSRVFPARLRAANPATGGRFEILLLTENAPDNWWAMMRPGKRARVGTRLRLLRKNGEFAGIELTVEETNDEGHRRLRFHSEIRPRLDELGEIPLPPYIVRDGERSEDRDRYQTIYAREPGSVAAPTAGLHFTESLLRRIQERGIETQTVTLHVGPGTFAPVKAEKLLEHRMHEEQFSISSETAEALNRARRESRRIVAVGTTTVRVLESAVRASDHFSAMHGRTSIFIFPPFEFRAVNALITNFHLPQSTLLMLVSAFASPGKREGREWILETYQEAIRENYRFFSYGDAMFLE
jgi:S-adenosylmethionine:tRNA ribosyltransferase-isomerase